MSQTFGGSAATLEQVFPENVVGAVPTPRLGGEFAKLWGATAASNLSDGIRVAALPLLAAATTTDPRQIAGVAFATQAPWLIFGMLSGAVVDRFEHRRIIAAAHLFRMSVVALLAITVMLGTVPVLALYAAAFLLGTAETLFDNASQVIVPELVDDRHLERANGRQTIAMLGGQHLIGPLLGASLFAFATPVPLMVDAGVLCLAAALILGIKRPPPQPRPKADTRIRAEVTESLRWLWSQQTLRTISLAAAVVNVAVMAHIGIFVLFSLEVLSVTGVGYALILACYAVGGMIGGWAAPVVTRYLGWRRSAVASLLIGGAAILLTGMTSSPVVTAIMQAVLGVGASVWMVVTSSLRQRLTPEAILGKVTGAHALLSWGGAAVGALVGGVMASALGLRAPFLVGGLVLLLLAPVIALVAVDRQPPASAV